jgi:hypothetical protein
MVGGAMQVERASRQRAVMAMHLRRVIVPNRRQA